MIFGSGSRLVPALVFTNLWTFTLLFLAWNHSARYEVAQGVRNVGEWLGVSPERTRSGEDQLLSVDNKQESNGVETGEGLGVHTTTQPVAQHPALPAFCPECGKGDALCARYGSVLLSVLNIDLSRLALNPLLLSSKYTIARSVAYGGASARLLRVLRNAQQGKPTKIGVLGGSVSKGHGIKPEQNWITLFEEWWTTVSKGLSSSITLSPLIVF